MRTSKFSTVQAIQKVQILSLRQLMEAITMFNIYDRVVLGLSMQIKTAMRKACRRKPMSRNSGIYIYSSYLIRASLIAFQPASKRTGDLPSMFSFAQTWKSSMSMDVVSTTLPAQLKIARGKGGILEWFAVTLILVTKAQAVVYAITQYSARGRK